MELFPRFIDSPPDFRAFRDDKPILLVSWWCTIYAMTIIFFRVVGRYIRTEKFYKEDMIMLLGIIPLLGRQATVHVVLLYGTNNTNIDGLSASSIAQREIGSKVVLFARILYMTYLWTIKLSTSTFLHNLIMSTASSSSKSKQILNWYYGFLFVMYFGTIGSAVGTCHPFSEYWRVVPNPEPECRDGHIFLVAMGGGHGITNLVLVLFPLPIIFASRLSGWKKFTILFRLALPLFSVVFTIYQVNRLLLSTNANTQSQRSLFASLDILLATFIANATVLMSLIRDRGFKKSKWKWQDVSEAGGVRRVKLGWDAQAGDWKPDMTPNTYTPAIIGGVEENRKRSWETGGRGSNEEEVELNTIGIARTTDEIERAGVERPEQAKLLGEIRVAREWEVTTSTK